MSISPFFQQLRSAYQSEIDDLMFDSEGRNVLRQRLGQKRKELKFLLQMLQISPEMVAVLFHQGFRFQSPALMEQLLSYESEDLPDWDTLADTVQLTPLAQELAQIILQEPQGQWFLSVAAGLEYLHAKPERQPAAPAQDEDDEEGDDDEASLFDEQDEADEEEARAREEAGADWMVEQGFDRKD